MVMRIAFIMPSQRVSAGYAGELSLPRLCVRAGFLPRLLGALY
jgi:hypothetical protein